MNVEHRLIFYYKFLLSAAIPGEPNSIGAFLCVSVHGVATIRFRTRNGFFRLSVNGNPDLARSSFRAFMHANSYARPSLPFFYYYYFRSLSDQLSAFVAHRAHSCNRAHFSPGLPVIVGMPAADKTKDKGLNRRVPPKC